MAREAQADTPGSMARSRKARAKPAISSADSPFDPKAVRKSALISSPISLEASACAAASTSGAVKSRPSISAGMSKAKSAMELSRERSDGRAASFLAHREASTGRGNIGAGARAGISYLPKPWPATTRAASLQATTVSEPVGARSARAKSSGLPRRTRCQRSVCSKPPKVVFASARTIRARASRQGPSK